MGISLLNELESIRSGASPVDVLQTLLNSRFNLFEFNLYLVNRDRHVIQDILTDKTVVMRHETHFIKSMPITHRCPEFKIYDRQESSGGWVYIVPNDTQTLVLYVDDKSSIERIDLHSLNFLLRLWFNQRKQYQLENKTKHFEEQILKIRNIGEDLAREHKFKELLSSILLDAMDMVNAAKGHIMTYDNDSKELKLQIVHGMANSEIDRLINDGKIPMEGIKPGQGVQGKVFDSGQPIKLDEVTTHDEIIDDDIHSIICVPLRMNEYTYGVLYVTNKSSRVPFTDTDLNLISILSSSVAAVMDQEKLFKESITDHLTGLFTRRYFEPKLEKEVLRAVRYHRPISIIAIDADHFKKVNDQYGHAAGDAVLIRIAQVINSCLRYNLDVSARYGGEEFLVFLPETDSPGAKVVAERIRKKMEKTTIRSDEHRIKITLSVGVATAPHQAKDSRHLIQLADEALYTSKQSGRNIVSLASSLES